MAVLRSADPRVLGGRDELAGGTWLAVNDAGVFAGLTNRPSTEGRDPAKRSRGEIPLALTGHRSARSAVESMASQCRPAAYNPAWALVGDRESLFLFDLTGEEVAVAELPPGLHVLENRAPDAWSPKVDRVRHLLAGIGGLGIAELEQLLRSVVADHRAPEDASSDRPATVDAACVHTEAYGTRWSGLVTVPAGEGPPKLAYADGPPCTAGFRDASGLWSA